MKIFNKEDIRRDGRCQYWMDGRGTRFQTRKLFEPGWFFKSFFSPEWFITENKLLFHFCPGGFLLQLTSFWTKINLFLCRPAPLPPDTTTLPQPSAQFSYTVYKLLKFTTIHFKRLILVWNTALSDKNYVPFVVKLRLRGNVVQRIVLINLDLTSVSFSAQKYFRFAISV